MSTRPLLGSIVLRSAWQAALIATLGAVAAIGIIELVAPSWKAGTIFLVLPVVGVEMAASAVLGLAFDPQAVVGFSAVQGTAVVAAALFVVMMQFRLGRAKLWRPFGVLAVCVVAAQVFQGVYGLQLAARRTCQANIDTAFFNDQATAAQVQAVQACAGRVAELPDLQQDRYALLQDRFTLLRGPAPAALADLVRRARAERDTLSLRWVLHDLIHFGAPQQAAEIAQAWLQAMPATTPYFDRKIYTDIEVHALGVQGRWPQAVEAEQALAGQIDRLGLKGNLADYERKRLAAAVQQLREGEMPDKLGAF